MATGKPIAASIAGVMTFCAGVALGAVVTVSMLISAFGDVAFVDAAERSSVLSEGINRSLVYGLGSGGVLSLVGLLLIGWSLWRASRTGSVAAPPADVGQTGS